MLTLKVINFMGGDNVKDIKILKGNIIYTEMPDTFTTLKNGYVIVEDGDS